MAVIFDRDKIDERFFLALDRMTGKSPGHLFKNQTDFSKKAGIKNSTLSNIRKEGSQRNVTLKMICALQNLAGSNFDIREVIMDDFQFQGIEVPEGYQLVKTESLKNINAFLESAHIETTKSIKQIRKF